MQSLQCSFCQHVNRTEAKYCNECGSALRLRPCARCDAVNDVDAAACHQCGCEFAEPVTAARAITAGSTARADSRSSVVRALETVSADLASLDTQWPFTPSAKRSPAPQDGEWPEMVARFSAPSQSSQRASAAPAQEIAAARSLASSPLAQPLPDTLAWRDERLPSGQRWNSPIRRSLLAVALTLSAFGIASYGYRHATHAVMPDATIVATTMPMSSAHASERPTAGAAMTGASIAMPGPIVTEHQSESAPPAASNRRSSGIIRASEALGIALNEPVAAAAPDVAAAPSRSASADCSDSVAALGLCSKAPGRER